MTTIERFVNEHIHDMAISAKYTQETADNLAAACKLLTESHPAHEVLNVMAEAYRQSAVVLQTAVDLAKMAVSANDGPVQ